MCLYPKLIRNRKYTLNNKNKGIIPELKDERAQFVPVGCGKCIECLAKKKREWQVRLNEEIKHSKNGLFVTLTFSNESLIKLEKVAKIKKYDDDIDNAIATYAIRHYFERIRKETGKSAKHWLITELGHQNTERIQINKANHFCPSSVRHILGS